MEKDTVLFTEILHSSGDLVLAFLLALPVALNREERTNIMGMRTFPLVAIGACAYTLISLQTFPDSPDTQGRVLQGLLSGLGFIGGGAILKNGNTVQGTACAASIWVMGAVGTAVGFGAYHIAVLLSLVNFVVLKRFPKDYED